jgi:flagellar biosynthesis protein
MKYNERNEKDKSDEEVSGKRAVAIKYTPEQNAPRVVAKGKGHVADNILNTAQSSSVPVYKNQTLVNMLMAVELDREIPPEMYAAVAEVLAYVYRIDKSKVTRTRPFIRSLLR